MDGYAVAKELRREHQGRVQLVPVSGYANPRIWSVRPRAGFDAHVALEPERIRRLLDCGALL